MASAELRGRVVFQDRPTLHTDRMEIHIERRERILAKLDLEETQEDHRRVLAVITFLDAH